MKYSFMLIQRVFAEKSTFAVSRHRSCRICSKCSKNYDMRCMYAGSKPYPLQYTFFLFFCRSVTVGAVDIVEAQKHTFVRCWFKGTIIQNRTFAASANRSCRHDRNAARVLTRTRTLSVLTQKPCPFPGCVFLLPLPFNGSCRLGRSAVS